MPKTHRPFTFSALTMVVLSALLLIGHGSAQAQTELIIHTFCPNGEPCADGEQPTSSLTPDGSGNFFGTTSLGGHYDFGRCGLGCGTVFELSPDGQGGWNEMVLYDFCSEVSCADGLGANGVISVAGKLYGTTSEGGINDCGVFFELSPAQGTWTEKVLYTFSGTGGLPSSGLIVDKAGNFYGTTSAGTKSNGSVYELSQGGNGWTEQVIYSAVMKTAGLVMDPSGNIYGVDNKQHVFELSPNGNGGWNASNILTFHFLQGLNPESAPVLDSAGNLYGTTQDGGSGFAGTVWELSPSKSGWKQKVLYSFNSFKKGIEPFAGVVLDSAGNIFGTTMKGGKDANGVIFELVPPVVKGKYKQITLLNFNITDGALPKSSLVLDGAGNLYGTAAGGSGGGVAFEVIP